MYKKHILWTGYNKYGQIFPFFKIYYWTLSYALKIAVHSALPSFLAIRLKGLVVCKNLAWIVIFIFVTASHNAHNICIYSQCNKSNLSARRASLKFDTLDLEGRQHCCQALWWKNNLNGCIKRRFFQFVFQKKLKTKTWGHIWATESFIDDQNSRRAA